MRTKYIFATEAKIFFANGLQIPSDWSPSIMATRVMISHLLDNAFLNCNSGKHVCSTHCGGVVRMLFGKRGACNGTKFRDAVSTDVIDMVDDFELLLDACLGRDQGETRMRSIGVTFIPCLKTLEIIETTIYLE